MSYVIITTAYNEARHIEETIKCVCDQIILPQKWIIYNDRSSDETGEIVKKYLTRYGWMNLIQGKSINCEDKGARIAGIINHCASLINVSYKYLVKLDADTSFEKDFFFNILKTFEERPMLGIASGRLMRDGEIEKITHNEHTRGATKVYRKECWDDIGGLLPTTGWDTLDDITAMYYKWETESLSYTFTHNKEEGAHLTFYEKYYQEGLFCGKVPYNFSYFVAKLFNHILDRPPFLSSIILLYAYLKMRFIIREKVLPCEISSFYQKRQVERLKRLLKVNSGKSAKKE